MQPLGIECVAFECGGFPTHLSQPRQECESGVGTQMTSIEDYVPGFAALGGMFASDDGVYAG